MEVSVQLREIILGAGFDLPQGPILPPLDLADEELAKVSAQLSRFAVALGREVDVHHYATTVPTVRSLTEVRQGLAGLLLACAGAAVQLGLEPERLLAEAVSVGSARRVLTEVPVAIL